MRPVVPVVPVVIRGSGGELPGRPLRVLPGLRFPPLCAGQPRRRDESRVPKAARERWRWQRSGLRLLVGWLRQRLPDPGPGEKSQHTERAATLTTGLRGLFPVLSLLGRLVETRCSCRRGGPPALFHRETRRGGRRRANGAPLRPTRSHSRRAAGQSPQKPHFNASRPPALSSSGSSPAPRKPRRTYANRSCWLCASVFAWTASKLHLCAPH